jgi:hypothetical protein
LFSDGQIGDGGSLGTTRSSHVAVSTSGVLSGKSILQITGGGYFHTCVIANDQIHIVGNE